MAVSILLDNERGLADEFTPRVAQDKTHPTHQAAAPPYNKIMPVHCSANDITGPVKVIAKIKF